MSKRISWPICLSIVAVLCAAQARLRADSQIAPFVDSQTSAVIYVDLSAVDLDQLNAWQQKALASAKVDPQVLAQQRKQADKSIASAKKWLSDFRTAGGKDMYIVISLAGMMQNAPGGLIIPLNGANPDALSKVFIPAGNPPPPDPSNPNAAAMQRMQQQTAVVGNMLVFSTGSGVEKLKTPSNEPRPDLTDALSAADNGMVRVAFAPSSLKNNPFFMMMMMNVRRMGGAQAAQPPFSEPQWDAVSWVSVSLMPPPKESGNCTIQCKDADSASALADLITKKMQDAKTGATSNGNMSADDFDKLMAAVKPSVSGTQVVMNLDQNTMDNVLAPMMARSFQSHSQYNAGPGPQTAPMPQQPPQENPAPPADNNGM